MKTIALMLAGVALLAACGEKPQTLGGSRQDAPAYSGTGVKAFTAADWTPGDKTSWEQKLKARGQYGMNEYTRTN